MRRRSRLRADFGRVDRMSDARRFFPTVRRQRPRAEGHGLAATRIAVADIAATATFLAERGVAFTRHDEMLIVDAMGAGSFSPRTERRVASDDRSAEQELGGKRAIH